MVNLSMNLWDHLHIRGEYLKLPSKMSPLLGSSPHTWRILDPDDLRGERIGIISTYVENTSPTLKRSNSGKDHLHIRGEYRKVSSFLPK